MSHRVLTRAGAAIGVVVVFVAITAAAYGMQFAAWSTAQKIDEVGGNHADLNTNMLDGCPIQSPDGLSLYLASNRPGGLGGLDIWVATRSSTGAPWGAPTNLGEPVNSASDDFCPTPVGPQALYFVSRELLPGACGQGDIYFTHRSTGVWAEPRRLACAPNGPNTPLDEQGPSLVDLGKRQFLYFSSSSASPAVAGDVYVSARRKWKPFGPAVPVTELNDAVANDIQPNVRADGLEVVFSSSRAGTLGGQDVWVATRAKVADRWSAPVNLGPSVNTAAGETRPSLSRDGNQLLFGRSPGPEGMSDVYVATR